MQVLSVGGSVTLPHGRAQLLHDDPWQSTHTDGEPATDQGGCTSIHLASACMGTMFLETGSCSSFSQRLGIGHRRTMIKSQRA